MSEYYLNQYCIKINDSFCELVVSDVVRKWGI